VKHKLVAIATLVAWQQDHRMMIFLATETPPLHLTTSAAKVIGG